VSYVCPAAAGSRSGCATARTGAGDGLRLAVAEDHDSNPLKRELAALKKRRARFISVFISVNPVKTAAHQQTTTDDHNT
jgi:hypothetical protein